MIAPEADASDAVVPLASTASAPLDGVLTHLADDGFVAYPTETVWGLGACADRPLAIDRLIQWKGRGENAPMSVLVTGLEAARALGGRFDHAAQLLAEAFWPGPLTLVVACESTFARGVAGSSGSLGIRCSPHPVAGALAAAVEAAGLGPLTSTSLNRSGEPPAKDLAAAKAILGRPDREDRAAPLLVEIGAFAPESAPESAVCDAGGETPSTVLDCTAGTPRILRAGAISAEELAIVCAIEPAEAGDDGETN